MSYKENLKKAKNFCFLAHGFDAKDRGSADSAFKKVKNIVSTLFDSEDSLEDLIQHYDFYSFS